MIAFALYAISALVFAALAVHSLANYRFAKRLATGEFTDAWEGIAHEWLRSFRVQIVCAVGIAALAAVLL